MHQATLVTDGSSDAALVPMLRWLLGTITPSPVELRWADLRGLPDGPRELADRLSRATALYPCQLLFVHRDAEREAPSKRVVEIDRANRTGVAHVCVIPVRMQEAWLLLDEPALREAAGRPSGTDPLSLSPARQWEQLPNPKKIIHQALVAASGATGRRAKRFNPALATHRLAELVEDWSALRQLRAFQALERDTRGAVAALGWARWG